MRYLTTLCVGIGCMFFAAFPPTDMTGQRQNPSRGSLNKGCQECELGLNFPGARTCHLWKCMILKPIPGLLVTGCGTMKAESGLVHCRLILRNELQAHYNDLYN